MQLPWAVQAPPLVLNFVLSSFFVRHFQTKCLRMIDFVEPESNDTRARSNLALPMFPWLIKATLEATVSSWEVFTFLAFLNSCAPKHNSAAHHSVSEVQANWS